MTSSVFDILALGYILEKYFNIMAVLKNKIANKTNLTQGKVEVWHYLLHIFGPQKIFIPNFT